MVNKSIEPWGVNIPFIYLATFMFTLGGISLSFDDFPFSHPYLMLIGAYALYFGMIQRLFFPARKYILTHVLSLILLGIPFSHYFQFLASIALIITEIWALKDVKSYGSRFVTNTLVLSTPFLSAVLWFLYLNLWSLTVPLLVYMLGVNIGVFTATLGVKPFFGKLQIPILLLSLLTIYFPFILPFALSLYTVTLLRKGMRSFDITALSIISLILISTFSSLIIDDETHAFYLDVMFPLFFSCITYSTARYNYRKVYVEVPLLALSYFFRFINLGISALFLPIAYIYFLYLIKDTLGVKGIKYGISKRFLEGNA